MLRNRRCNKGNLFLYSFSFRFHCNLYDEEHNPYDEDANFNHHSSEDMFLSVQTLQFQGNQEERQARKPPRTCFKYKALTHENRHRMFVKEIVEDPDNPEEDCSSQQNSFYLDDYVKYIMTSDRSRPSTGKSSLYLTEDITDSRDKATQVESKRSNLKNKQMNKPKIQSKKSVKLEDKEPARVFNKDNAMEGAKISYHKFGKRKSITISRAQSPETVQVIRVDVVCNYSSAGSTVSDFEDTKKHIKMEDAVASNKEISRVGIRNTNFANKYLLTKSIKSLDENVSGGAKVTLLCKTYRLADRVPASNDKGRVPKENRKQIKTNKTKTFGLKSKTKDFEVLSRVK